MDRIWQWAWDRYGAKYSWAICAVSLPMTLPIYLASSLIVVAFEESRHYVEVAAVTLFAVLVLLYAIVLPGLNRIRPVEQWAAGHEVDPATALEATYTWGRDQVARAVGGHAASAASRSSSRRSPGRPGRGSSSTDSWAR